VRGSGIRDQGSGRAEGERIRDQGSGFRGQEGQKVRRWENKEGGKEERE